MATGIEDILKAYCSSTTIPMIENARLYEGGAKESQDVWPLSKGVTYKIETVDRSAPSGGKYNQRGPMSGDIFTMKVYAMTDSTGTAESIMQAILAELIKGADTFNAAMSSAYDYSHLLFPNLKDISVVGEHDYKLAVFTVLASKSTKENY
jgi:hypothetical protein